MMLMTMNMATVVFTFTGYLLLAYRTEEANGLLTSHPPSRALPVLR
jgi:hypothetical protein